MIDVYIQTKDGVQAVDGYKLPNGLACHKNLSDNKTWVVVDLNSGLYLKKDLKTLGDCQIYSRHFPDREKVEELKKGNRYKEYLKKIKDYKSSLE